jgi:phosphoribosylformylglycinamidine synthase
VAEGGLAVALAEAAIWSGVGAEIDLRDDPVELFGEGGGRVILAVPADHRALDDGVDPTGSKVAVQRIGVVVGPSILDVPVADLRAAWESEA